MPETAALLPPLHGSVSRRPANGFEPAWAAVEHSTVSVAHAIRISLRACTFNLALVDFLPEDSELTVATHSIDIAAAVLRRADLQLVMIGGAVDPAVGGCVDAVAVQSVGQLNIDRFDDFPALDARCNARQRATVRRTDAHGNRGRTTPAAQSRGDARRPAVRRTARDRVAARGIDRDHVFDRRRVARLGRLAHHGQGARCRHARRAGVFAFFRRDDSRAIERGCDHSSIGRGCSVSFPVAHEPSRPTASAP